MSEVIELHRPSPAVEVRDLRKEFSRRDKKAGRFARKKRAALTGVTFTMERGECVAAARRSRKLKPPQEM